MSDPTPPDAAPQPYSVAAPASDRPPIPASTPVYTAWIWIIVFLPVVGLIEGFLYRPEIRYHSVRGIQTPDYASIFTPAYFIVLGVSLLLYGLTVVMAFADRRELMRRGVERPFHWAWAFLTSPVYIIGRSVIVHRVARPRGLAPIWVFVGVWVVSIVVNFAATLSQISETLRHMPNYPG